jgi:hypothetical protein
MNAGEIAAELVGLIVSELEAADETGRRIIANRIVEAIAGWLPPQAQRPAAASTKPMTDAESVRYGNERMRFGEFTGWRVEDVPLSYLSWLADASRQTWSELHRYLRSPRIQRQLRTEEP